MKNIFIGPSVRSGGSLLNRLFDHHHNIAVYPFELILPMDEALHPTLNNRGQKQNIQNYPTISENASIQEIMSKLQLNRIQQDCYFGKHFRNNKLKAKTSFLNIDAEYHHDQFIEDFNVFCGEDRNVSHIYKSLHKAFFKNWDNDIHSGSMDFVVYHSGNGLLADIEFYLGEFKNSYFIQPIRSAYGYLASEKKKVLRQLIGRGRIGRLINLPDNLLIYYYGRFFETTLVNWLVTLTRSVILKEKLGKRYIVYRHEDLVRNPEIIMKKLSDAIGLNYHKDLIIPTVGGVLWHGNSMYGKQNGINPKLADVRNVFNKVELSYLNKYCSYILNYLDNFKNELIDFNTIDHDALFDYDIQSSIYLDRVKTALYFSSMYERWKYSSVWSSIKSAISKNPKPFFLE